MILDTDTFLGYNFNVAGEFPESKIQHAIEDAELYCVKQKIGDANYISLLSDTTEIVNGGTVTDTEGNTRIVAGVKKAIAYIAHCLLLYRNVTVTNFGTVEKKDEYSENITRDEIKEVAKLEHSIGMQYLRDVCDVKGWAMNKSGNFFNEYM